MDDASEVVIVTVVNPSVTMTMTATSTNAAAVRASVAVIVDHLRDSLSECRPSFDWHSLRPFLWAVSILGTACSFLVLASNLQFPRAPGVYDRTRIFPDGSGPEVDKTPETLPKDQSAENLTAATETDKNVRTHKHKKNVCNTQDSSVDRSMTPVSETFLFQIIFAFFRSLLLHLLLQSFDFRTSTAYISNQTFNSIIVWLANVCLECSMHGFRRYGEQKKEVAV